MRFVTKESMAYPMQGLRDDVVWAAETTKNIILLDVAWEKLCKGIFFGLKSQSCKAKEEKKKEKLRQNFNSS